MSVLKLFNERFPSFNSNLNSQVSLNTLASRHTHQQPPINYSLTNLPKSLFPTRDHSTFTEEPDFFEDPTKKFKKDSFPLNLLAMDNTFINNKRSQMSYPLEQSQYFPDALLNIHHQSGLNTKNAHKKAPAIINLEDEDDEEDCLIIENKPSIDSSKELASNIGYPSSLPNDFALQNGQLYQNNSHQALSLMDSVYQNPNLSMFQSLAGINGPGFIPQNDWGSLSTTGPFHQDDNPLLKLQVLKLWDFAKIPEQMMQYVQNYDQESSEFTDSNNTEFNKLKSNKGIETIIIDEEEIEPEDIEKGKPVNMKNKEELKKPVLSNKWEQISVISDDSEKSIGSPDATKIDNTNARTPKSLNSKRNFLEVKPETSSKKLVGRPRKQNEQAVDKEDPCPVEVDPTLQAKIPALEEKRKGAKKRQLKYIWNPENVQRKDLEKYFEQLDNKTESTITNEESKINLLKDFGLDMKRTIEYVSSDVAFYKRFFRFTRKRVKKNYASDF